MSKLCLRCCGLASILFPPKGAPFIPHFISMILPWTPFSNERFSFSSQEHQPAAFSIHFPSLHMSFYEIIDVNSSFVTLYQLHGHICQSYVHRLGPQLNNFCRCVELEIKDQWQQKLKIEKNKQILIWINLLGFVNTSHQYEENHLFKYIKLK